MPHNRSEPLTDADYAKINENMYALANLHGDIQRALQAGFDCAPEDARCKAAKERYAAIKKAYFPERP